MGYMTAPIRVVKPVRMRTNLFGLTSVIGLAKVTGRDVLKKQLATQDVKPDPDIR